VSTSSAVARHVGRRYRAVFRTLGRPFRSAEREAHHLHQVERAGESGETPYIAMLGLILFLGSVFALMLAVTLIAYYVA
jgi:hypothetical protein